MNPLEFISTFSKLHEKAKSKSLEGDERMTYNSRMDEIARGIVTAQRIKVLPGETPRQALKVARALQVDLDLSWDRVRVVTLDISVKGFSCYLEKAPPATEEVGFALRIPGSVDPIIGRCVRAELDQQRGHVRARFAFQDLNSKDLERIERVVFDSIIEQLQRPQAGPVRR